MIYRFDDYSLDDKNFALSKQNKKVSLEPKVFDVLTYLIKNREKVHSKDELIDELWDGRVISDAALNTCIRSVRRALDDDAKQHKYIQTFPKRGFQFVA
ncbi:MAG: transcriptional regulator, partial [Cocleimonas sp.]